MSEQKTKTQTLIEQYLEGGRIPWSPGYSKYKNKILIDAINDPEMLDRFRTGAPLPHGYGERMDERVVECPWAIAKIGMEPGHLLDAGEVLNTPYFLDTPQLKARHTIIWSYELSQFLFYPNVSYLHGDFREPLLRNGIFKTICCISTLEHVGMWWIPKPPFEVTLKQPQVEKDFGAFKRVLKTFHDLLEPGGRILITVPYGYGEDQDWMRIFDQPGVQEIKDAFGGTTLSETYYRHFAVEGWRPVGAHECGDARYFNIVKTPEFGTDYAAAARAVACLELQRD
jgi:hypothetical protein